MNTGGEREPSAARTVEGDGSQGEPKYHAGRGPYHNLSPSYDVNVLEGNKCENEVGPSNNKPDGSGVIKPYRLEQACAVVHQGIKSTELLKSLEPTADDCQNGVNGQVGMANMGTHSRHGG